ncbi:MAG: transcriptional repressor [Anaerolineae bacterium]|nr:transcriptional repressor [Anaerolineae bacterium]MBN8619953.1 transcriptional repressor [Anaerolineae bacterium]
MTFQEQAKEAIRATGGRITGQRELLLDLIATHDEIDAEHLHRIAHQQDPTISLPTVYRTLHTLEDAHVITSRYISAEHERKLYRVPAKQDSTFHFTCRRCGQVIPFHSDLIEQIKQEIAARIDIELWTLCMCAGGLCPNCREER